MHVQSLSTCFVTDKVDQCRDFYTQYFGARPIFDSGWYLTLQFDGGQALSFIAPQEGMTAFTGAGVMLNVNVADVDAEAAKLESLGLTIAMPLEDHPWGDRGFAVVDPIGNSVYMYSDRPLSEEFLAFKLD